MNWFKRHLNLTWFIVVSLASQMGTLYNIGVPLGIIMLVISTLVVSITIWVLYQKGRDFLWVVCPISVLFLRNDNDSFGVKARGYEADAGE